MADTEQQPLLSPSTSQTTSVSKIRHRTKTFLTSQTGHYSILLLVSLDISSIFADLIVSSLACEGHIPSHTAEITTSVLGIVSLVFSCLFMLELLASIWAFGKTFFNSYFHIFDSVVILTSFILDILLRGSTLEEIGSVVIVLRFWRVLKIIDELSAGAAEQMEPLNQRIEELEKEVRELRATQQRNYQ